MANITVSSSNNFDASTNLALNNGETITLNTGAVLTMNSDNRWSQNAAVPLNITIDAASGGELLMDGRDVWWLPYTSGSGTVPVLGTTFPAGDVTSGTASGEFLGVFTGLGVAPSSGTMPATGFIKLRSKTGNFANAQALILPGGATATASGVGQRGWLNIVGAETGTITIPRLGKWTARGDWFDLATTTGSRDQTIQYFVADYCPALWIETSAGSGVYEIWLNAGARWSATYVSMDARGKFFGCTAAGVITLAATGFGKLPASGCKIRVPNIHISSTTAANYALNTLNANQFSRWETSASNFGYLDCENIATSGVMFNLQTTFYVRLKNTSMLDGLLLGGIVSLVDFEEVAVGIATTVSTNAFYISNTFGGATLKNCRGVTYSGQRCVQLENVKDCTIDGGSFAIFAATGNPVIYVNNHSHNAVIKDCEVQGGTGISVYASVDALIQNIAYSDTMVGGVQTASGTYCVDASGAHGITVDGISLIGGGSVPRYRIVNLGTVSDFTIRNIGSYASPLNCLNNTIYPLHMSYASGKVQRCYFSNTVSGIAYISGANNITYESVMSDYTLEVLPQNSHNTIIKGYFGGLSGLGSNGIQVSLGHFGTHFYDTFQTTTYGAIGIMFCEPTQSTLAYVQTTNGAVEFSGAGSAYLRDLGDQLTYTWPHFILGYTSLANVAPALSGTNTGNLTIEYDLDKGSGFSGAWKTCNAANLSAETGISATTGFKPKFRFTCATASTSNAINGFYITGTTDATSQQTQYPLDVSTLTLTGLPVAAEVRCYTGAKDGSAVEIGGVEATGGTTFTFTHSSGGSSGFIHIIHPSYKIKEIDYTYAVADTELLIQMDPDPWYSNPV